MGPFIGLRQGSIPCLQVHVQNSFIKDENTTVKPFNDQLPESGTVSRLANFGKTGIRMVLRRMESSYQQEFLADVDDTRYPPNMDVQATLIALHNACSNKSDVQVIRYLVARHPDGAQARQNGNLPLHTALARGAPLDVIEYLLEAYSEGTGDRNTRHKLPIHIALECGASLGVIRALVKCDPDSLEVADYDIVSVQFSDSWILHKVSDASMGGQAGLPLHTACKYLASLQTINFLIKAYPGK